MDLSTSSIHTTYISDTTTKKKTESLQVATRQYYIPACAITLTTALIEAVLQPVFLQQTIGSPILELLLAT